MMHCTKFPVMQGMDAVLLETHFANEISNFIRFFDVRLSSGHGIKYTAPVEMPERSLL